MKKAYTQTRKYVVARVKRTPATKVCIPVFHRLQAVATLTMPSYSKTFRYIGRKFLGSK